MLPRSFFNRPAPVVARDLLGRELVRRLPEGGILRCTVTETEAYDGFEDQASHAHRGKTPRNAVMFGPPGFVYLYLCYGVHWLLNLTTGPEGHPAAVLIRGCSLASGPGRLTRALRLGRAENLMPLGPRGGLWLNAGRPAADNQVFTSPRIGIDYAGDPWKEIHWRFVLRTPSGSCHPPEESGIGAA